MNLNQPRSNEVHRTGFEQDESQHNLSLDHCTQISCSLQNLPHDSYGTKHVDGCSGCPEFAPDHSTLVDILLSDSIPAISMVARGYQSNHLLRRRHTLPSLMFGRTDLTIFKSMHFRVPIPPHMPSCTLSASGDYRVVSDLD
jgi:hypothetical protein